MIRLREATWRHGRSSAGVAAISLVLLILLWAHSAPGGHHMPDPEMGVVAIGTCLAVLEGGGVLLLGLGLVYLMRRVRPSLAPQLVPPMPLRSSASEVPARPRAGPSLFQVFLR